MQNFNERKGLHFSNVVVIYTFICIVYQMLVIIYPVKAFFAIFPFSIFSKGLCILGVIITAVDLLTDRITLKGTNMKWLFLMLISVVVSTLFRVKYGFAENVKVIMWNSVQMLLIYTLPFRISKDSQKKLLMYIHSAGCIIFIPVLCYMFNQFINLEYYVNAEGTSQGWFEGRLFGVMNTLYYGTSIVAVLAFGSIYLFFVSKNLLKKSVYSVSIVIYLLYIALSDSRSIYVGCIAGLFVIFFFGDFMQNTGYMGIGHYLQRHFWGYKRKILSAFLFVFTIIILSVGVKTIRNTGMELAYNHVITKYGQNAFEKLADKSEDQLSGQISGIESPKDLGRPKQATITSRRVYIWKSYAEILGDKATNVLIGLSPRGYAGYIIEHYPENYIVKDFGDYYPIARSRGNVYGTHNAYLYVLVTTGLLGIVSLFAFLLSSAGKFLKKISRSKDRTYEAFLCSIIVMMLSFVLFEIDIFYSTTAMSFLFWLISGMLMAER